MKKKKTVDMGGVFSNLKTEGTDTESDDSLTDSGSDDDLDDNLRRCLVDWFVTVR